MNRLSVTAAMAIAVALGASGCGPDASDEAGRDVVTSDWTEGSTPQEARVSISLGRLDGDPMEVFGRLGAVAVGPDQQILVTDLQASEVRVFTAAGQPVRTIGGPGEGPGDFETPVGVSVDSAGRVWVYDPGNQKLVQFDSVGAVLNTVRRPTNSVVLPWPGGPKTDGFVYDWAAELPNRSGRDPGDVAILRPIRLATDGGGWDSLPPITGPVDAVGGRRRPYENRTVIAQDVNGAVWSANSRSYQITKRTPEGDTLMVLQLNGFPTQAVTDHEKDSILDVYNENAARFGRPEFGASEIPDQKATIDRIVAHPDGRILVFSALDGRPVGRGAEIFAVSGEFLGSVRFPVDVQLDVAPVWHGDRLYAASIDDAGVPQLVAFNFESRGR